MKSKKIVMTQVKQSDMSNFLGFSAAAKVKKPFSIFHTLHILTCCGKETDDGPKGR